MLKKKNRLTYKDILFLYKHQKIIFCKDFVFFYFPSKNFKIWFVVSKKINKHSSKRNILKRLFYRYLYENNINFNYKIFISINKNRYNFFSNLLNKSKIEIKNTFYIILNENFDCFLKKINIKNEKNN